MKQAVLRVAISSAAVLVVASIARADAPPGQYGLFNGTDVYILDSKTGLRWERFPTSTQMKFVDAATHCSTLSLGVFSSGWRVPSYKELLTIVDEQPHLEYRGSALVSVAIDGNAFPQTPVDNYFWTSSVFPQDSTFGYAVIFSTGQAFQNTQGNSAYVRCVHDG